jgi:hypothetical protein
MSKEAEISRDSVIGLREIYKENLRSILRLKVSLVHHHLDRALLRMLRNPLALHWTLLPLVG